jgi:hypothetical protein
VYQPAGQVVAADAWLGATVKDAMTATATAVAARAVRRRRANHLRNIHFLLSSR